MGDVDDRILDLEKQERVKARWAMLRHALLKNTNKRSPSSADDDVTSSSNYSMNAFPGFNLLDRTIFNSASDDGDTPPTTPEATAPAVVEHEYHLVRNSYTPSNNSSNSRPISFITRETTIIDPYSHIKYNGIDNTGNVRVWDAESTLAAFLLSIILDDDDEDIVELLKVKIDESCANEQQQQSIVHLRRDVRSMIMTRPRSSLLRNNNSNNNKKKQSPLSDDACNILELGAGQAGLAGLAIANIAHLYNGMDNIKSLCIVITDGHPTCIANNKVCARLVSSISSSNNKSSTSSGGGVSLQVELLCWDSSVDVGVETCTRINKLVDNENWITNIIVNEANVKNKEEEPQQQRPVYHLVLASDCTHFTNYHDGLLLTIARTLIVGGVALLCQPHRGSTLNDFMTLTTVVVNNANNNIGIGPLFRMTLYEEFHTKITSMHKSLLLDKESVSSKSNTDDDDITAKSLLARSYDPNRHLPLLLVLVKLRPYDETIDGDTVRGYHNNITMRS